MRKSNLTYEQLIKLAPKDRPFQIEVKFSSGISYGKEILWAYITDGDLWTIFEEYSRGFWKDKYKNTFTLIDEYRNMYEKPEVLEVGTEVEILESARDCGDYERSPGMEDMIGETFKIEDRDDGISGVNYLINSLYTIPHYCVRPVEKVEEKEENLQGIPGFDGMIEEFEGLCIKAQDIINKYKK
jgi:hypothetical protein